MFNYPIGKGGMPPKKMAKAPVANPADQDEMHAGEDGDPDLSDRPVHTEHHQEGGHTTVHESGAEKHHATAEELVEHLKKYLPEEEKEIADDEEPTY